MAAFISQQDLSDFLGRDVTADPGAIFAVQAACDVCRVVAEQNFDLQTDTITLDGTGTDTLLLPELPVLAAGTVLVAGGTVLDYVLADNGRLIRKRFAGTAGTATDDWWLTDWGWSWPFGSFPTSPSLGGGMPPGPVWPMGRQNVTVTYDHGYAGTLVPMPIRQVALNLAARQVTQGAGAVAETVGMTSVRYAGPAGDLTNGEKAILRKYRPTR